MGKSGGNKTTLLLSGPRLATSLNLKWAHTRAAKQPLQATKQPDASYWYIGIAFLTDLASLESGSRDYGQRYTTSEASRRQVNSTDYCDSASEMNSSVVVHALRAALAL